MFDLYLTIGEKGVCVKRAESSAFLENRPKLRNEGGSFDKRRVCVPMEGVPCCKGLV